MDAKECELLRDIVQSGANSSCGYVVFESGVVHRQRTRKLGCEDEGKRQSAVETMYRHHDCNEALIRLISARNRRSKRPRGQNEVLG